MKKLLVIGRTFPEPSTTAAGKHMMDLLDFFLDEAYQIIFSSTASLGDHSAPLEERGIQMQSIRLNDSGFDDLLLEFKPDVVLFDRFITEEQFGWRVSEHLPHCFRVLDTEDLHFLRRGRQLAHKNQVNFTDEFLYSDDTKRELASILRCDLSLIMSEFEYALLKDKFKIPEELLMYLPLLADIHQKQSFLAYQNRQHFTSIGNFNHAPNLDAVRFLKEEIWPVIRAALPQVELHVYGAYAPEQIKQMHKPNDGFLIKGWVEDINQVVQEAKVCLAPLRFGAGLKGKLMDAMRNGTPMVTTSIGAEGMYGDYQVPGRIAKDAQSIADAAVELYTDEDKWQACLTDVDTILNKRFNKKQFKKKFASRLEHLTANLNQHRKTHFIGQIIQHHSLQSTKYMSKWIEEKGRHCD